MSLWMTLIILGVIAAFVVMAIYKDARPYLNGLLCLAIIGSGAYFSFIYWDYQNTHSNVVGELVEHDPYEDFNFYEYELEDFALVRTDTKDGEGNIVSYSYGYEITYATSVEFNGTENKYTLLINDKPCDETQSSYGKLTGFTTIHYDGVDGEEMHAIDVKVTFTFYQSSINLKVETNATDINAKMIEEYFKINGFNLRIIEEINIGTPILTDSTVA